MSSYREMMQNHGQAALVQSVFRRGANVSYSDVSDKAIFSITMRAIECVLIV
jgi:hypothetical protein